MDEPKAPDSKDPDYEEKKKEYEIKCAKWERSNRMSLMIIKQSIPETIRGAIESVDKAKEYLKKVEDQFKGSSKVYANSLIKRLVNDTFDGSIGMREHIMRKSNIAAKLKGLEMPIPDAFLVHIIMNSLPQDFGPFVINYNAMNVKWTLEELTARCVQEEERLKAEKIDYINQIKDGKKFNVKPNNNNQFKKKGPQKQTQKWFKNEGKGQKVQPTPQSQPQKVPQQESDSNGCYHCGKPGHRRSDCIKFIKWLARKGNDEVTFIDESLYVNYATNSW